MPSRFLGQYLLEKGAIDSAALLQALERQRRVNLSLLDLAVEQERLTEAQAEQIRDRYRTSSASLDDLMMSSGLLSPQVVESLRGLQRARWLPIGSALVQGGALSAEELNYHLIAYRRQEEDVRRHLTEELASLPNGRVAGAFLDLTAFHYGRLTGAPAKLASVARVDGRARSDAARFVQHFVGDHDLWFVIDLTPPVLDALSRRLLPESVTMSPETMSDAACEFVNVVGGNTCTHLEPAECRLRPEPPFSPTAEPPFLPAPWSVRGVVVSAENELDVHLFFNAAEGGEPG